ncbi:MAG: DUF2066 domain-containing protein [Gammaproteobacteria bacterium]|nr:DUF2066 domain-containing protein [Gammaproteobacteria bacterium]MDH5172178.1 DUF2066 domain-containing protein [Gammaproteobacteria bacterium]
MIKHIARGLGFALLLLSVAGAARAEMVRDLYSAEVPVADQSATELARASRLALSEVLVKVSGSEEVLRNPAISAALGEARNRVERYSYSEGPGVPPPLEVNLRFDSAYITDLVIGAGAPIWNANRPVVLVWLVIEDAAGRQFANTDTSPALVAALRKEFDRRGVPLQLPLYDVADSAALTPDQAWNPEDPALALASARYNLQDVVAGRVSLLESGAVAGEWSFRHGEDQLRRPSTAASEELFLRDGAALVAEAMAARYAVAASASDGDITVAVSGVTTYADYAAVISWLEKLELVDRADIEAVRGDTITLRLQAKAGAVQLASLIELNKQLVPLPAGGPGAQLSYQWQR